MINITVRELVNELTKEYIDWDLEIHVCVASEPVKNGEEEKCESYKIDRCDLFQPTWYVGDQCHLVLERKSPKKDINKDKIIKKLDKLKEDYPEQIISIETSSGCAECKIGDALIYESTDQKIVIDSE